MKILYVVSNFNLTGGKERHDRAWIEVLKKSHELHIVKLKNTAILSKILFVYNIFAGALKFKPDIIFCAHINFSPICLLLNKICRAEYLISTYGVEVWDIKNKLKIKSLKNSKAILSISLYTKKKLEEKIPNVEGKIHIVPCTIAATRFTIKGKSQDLIEKHGLKNKKVILSVSRLYRTEKNKGIEKVIRALPLVKKEIPNISYVIVGKGSNDKKLGDDRDRLTELAKSIGVEDDVIMAGRISDYDLVDYYNTCDLFILPSKKEGFGIVFLEALACGKPVIAGGVDGSREALLDGELGTIINPDSIEEIAQAIISTLNGKTPSKLTDSNFLRSRAIEAYGFANFQKKVLNLMDEVKKRI